jgi:hypothetical protein
MNSCALARRAASSTSASSRVAAIGDVVAHRAVEQEDVLLHDREQAAVRASLKSRMSEPLTRIRPSVGSWKRATRSVTVVLPAPLGPRARRRAAGHRDVEVADNRPPSRYSNSTCSSESLDDAGPARIGPVGSCRPHAQHLEHRSIAASDRCSSRTRLTMLQTGLRQQERVPLERHDVADRGVATFQIAAEPEMTTLTRETSRPQTSTEQLAALREQLLAQHGVPAAHVVEQLALLATERAHDANARERLADAAVDLLDVFADGAIDRADAPREAKLMIIAPGSPASP